MKKITLSELILLINQTEKEANYNFYNVLNNSIVIKDRELDGKETILNEIKEFDQEYNLYVDSINKLECYKNKLSKANATSIAYKDMTILETLNNINNLKKQLNLLEELCDKTPSLKRCFDGNGSNAYYKVEKLNFDLDIYSNKKHKIQLQINTLESAIQQANANTFVQID